MFALLDRLPPAGAVARRLGTAFLAAYLALISVAYLSQVVLVPRFLAAGEASLARAWYFGSHASIAYFVNQLGYCLWGAGALILFLGPLRTNGLPRVIAAFYCLSGVLSLVAFAGLLVENDALNRLTLPGGLMLLPVGILTAIWGMRSPHPPFGG